MGCVAAFEVLVATYAVRNLIREGKGSQLRNMIATGGKYGMQTLEQGLSDLVTSGVVDYQEAVARSLYPDDVTRAARLAQAASKPTALSA